MRSGNALQLLLVSCGACYALTIRIPSDHPTIQGGLDAAGEGDTVLVSSGTYTGDGNRDLSFNGVDLILRSEAGASATVIDAQASTHDPHRGLRFWQGESSAARVEGLTITGGWELFGGGLLCEEGSSPSIDRCVITQNDALDDTPEYTGSGGGIYCLGSAPMITNCMVSGNRAFRGGGICCAFDSDATVADCTIKENTAIEYDGGGIRCYWSSPSIVHCAIVRNATKGSTYVFGGGGIDCGFSSAVISHCIIAHNRSEGGVSAGAGISCGTSSPQVTNTIIAFNTNRSLFRSGAGVYSNSSSAYFENCTIFGNSSDLPGGGINSEFYDTTAFVNCIVWQNSPDQVYLEPWTGAEAILDYCDVQGGWEGEGNFSLDPHLVSIAGLVAVPAPFSYWDGDTFVPRSPCIDRGHPEIVDGFHDGHPRWPFSFADGARSNLGAYGGPGNLGWLR